jgi:uracil-DNA glycosylase
MEVVTQAQLEWAHRYDGYRRLASSPEKLEELLRGARNSYASGRRIPDWCGVDVLRGWAFLLARTDHHQGGGTMAREWLDVLAALRVHPDARERDRPPAGTAEVPLPTVFSTEPKRHRQTDFLAAKRARLWEPHVAPINHFVDRIRQEISAELLAGVPGAAPAPVHVPYVDPDSGGIRARILFVLESPAGPAALGSGMLSADNNDETAKNMWQAYRDSGVPRTYGLHWNAVPWYVGNGKKNAPVTPAQVELGRRHLIELLELAPDLTVILALGRPAQASLAGVSAALHARGVRVIHAPHPSPIQAGVTRGRSLIEVTRCLSQALEIAGA